MTFKDDIPFIYRNDFNSHAHVERDIWVHTHFKGTKNFNSHAHVERDTYCDLEIYSKNISTHTLTWSVTVYFIVWHFSILISTHTLTWSVTLDVVYIWCLLNVMRTYFFI